MIKIRTGLKEKVLAGFLLGLLAIGLIGYQVHSQMTNLASSLYNSNRPNQLVQYQKIFSTLSDAESSVRSYSITNDKEDLQPFYKSKSRLTKNLAEINESNNSHLITLGNLIHKKIFLMEEIIRMKSQNPSADLLDKALNKIDNLKEAPNEKKLNKKNSGSPKIALEENEKANESFEKKIKEKKEKKNFLQKLFSRKKPDKKADNKEKKEQEEANTQKKERNLESSELTETEEEEEEEETKKIKNSLQQLKLKNRVESSAWQQEMLTLIKKDNELMQRIRVEMNKLEEKEKHNQSLIVNAAARSKSILVNNTTAVGVGAFTLILILSLVIVQDFDKLRKNRLSLINEKEKANQHARAKEKFLANMSHEIRTPMNAIVGYSELMEKTSLQKEQKNYLKTIRGSANHLMVVINDILDYSKLESGKLSINQEPFNPVECIDQVIESMANEVDKNGIELRKVIDPSVNEKLLGDPIRFQQILFNLVSNSIKFTDKGFVSIQLSGTDQNSQHLLKLKVKDTGSGIGKEYQEKIFENFEQAETGRGRKHGGTGLGLAIVKRLVELHNGKIKLESEVGEGTEITIQIPYHRAKVQKQKKKIASKKKSTEIDFSSLNILAVDDQEYNLELVNIILNKWGANIKTVSSAKEAIKLLDNHDYDLVLMDVQMPEMTGIEATEIIRETNKELPIIALTAASTKSETDSCLHAGMDDILLKPFKQKELLEILKKYSPSKDEKQAEHSFSYSFKNLSKLSNGNESFMADMLEVFNTNILKDYEALKKHIASKEMEGIKRISHKMIAPCSHLKMEEIVSMLKDIEKYAGHQENISEIRRLSKDIKPLIDKAVKLSEKEAKRINQKEYYEK